MYTDAIIVNYAIMMWNVYLFITKRHIKTFEPILVFCGESGSSKYRALAPLQQASE